jgi:hypothetical protein
MLGDFGCPAHQRRFFKDLGLLILIAEVDGSVVPCSGRRGLATSVKKEVGTDVGLGSRRSGTS